MKKKLNHKENEYDDVITCVLQAFRAKVQDNSYSFIAKSEILTKILLIILRMFCACTEHEIDSNMKASAEKRIHVTLFILRHREPILRIVKPPTTLTNNNNSATAIKPSKMN